MTAGAIYRALWRHKVLILLSTAVCVGATWYATSRQHKTYEASVLVRVQQAKAASTDPLNAYEASQRVARTYATMIDSGALDARVRGLVAGRAPADGPVEAKLGARPVEDLELLWVTARSRSPGVAALVANAAPQALRDFSDTSRNARDRIVTVKAASVPHSPVSPDLALNVGLALVLALIFNCVLALVIEAFQDRLPELDEFGSALGVPVIATIPALRLKPLSALDGGGDATRVAELEIDRLAGAATGVGERDADGGS